MRKGTRHHLIALYRERIRNIYDNVMRFHWTHEKLIYSLKENVWDEANYKRLPEYSREYLAGYEFAQDENLRKHLVFSYMIFRQGRTIRTTIDSTEYQSIPAQEICEKYGDTGCYVWRDAPDKRYDNPRSER